jgi:small subunit ribosomal protein S17
MSDKKDEAKKPADKKSTAAKVVDGVKGAVKSAVKSVTDKVQHALHPDGDAPRIPGRNGVRVERKRGQRRILSGIVKSDKMDKTVVVEVVSLKRDPVYGKYLKSRVRYKAHDEKNQFHTGDRVEIQEHRPLSRDKRFTVSKLIEKARVE